MLLGDELSSLHGANVGVESRSGDTPVERRHHVNDPLIRSVGPRQSRVEQRKEILDGVRRTRRLANLS